MKPKSLAILALAALVSSRIWLRPAWASGRIGIPGRSADPAEHPAVLRRARLPARRAGLSLVDPGHVHVLAAPVPGRDLRCLRRATCPIWEDLMDNETVMLTPNSQVVYVFNYLDLKTDGPTVLEAPPKLAAMLDSMWDQPITDIGATGPDKGQGGKYLVLPPGYEGDVPDGYFVVQLAHLRRHGRPAGLHGERLDRQCRGATQDRRSIYPLAQKDNPPRDDVRQRLGQADRHAVPDGRAPVLQPGGSGPAGARRRQGQGHVRHAGHHRDQEGRAVQPRCAHAEDPEEGGPDGPRHRAVAVPGAAGPGRLVLPGQDLDACRSRPRTRSSRSTTACCWTSAASSSTAPSAPPPAWSAPMSARARSTSTATPTNQREFLHGENTYRLVMPPDVPAKDFWSLTVYDVETRSMLKNGTRFPNIDSYRDLEDQRRRIDRSLLRAGGSGRVREQLGEDGSGQGLVRDDALLRAGAALLRQDLADERFREEMK